MMEFHGTKGSFPMVPQNSDANPPPLWEKVFHGTKEKYFNFFPFMRGKHYTKH